MRGAGWSACDFSTGLRRNRDFRGVHVGCGNGAFTELIVDRCAPRAVHGVDPSEGQLAYARSRPGARLATFETGDAMALPSPPASFDAAVMALVIFFVPEPALGVDEMTRVVRPGGLVSAYAWDMLRGGFPLEPLHKDMRAMGMKPLWPPRAEISTSEALLELWAKAGLMDVATTEFTVTRTFDGFDDLWESCISASSMKLALATMSPSDLERLKAALRVRLPADASRRITYDARANAVKGRTPA